MQFKRLSHVVLFYACIHLEQDRQCAAINYEGCTVFRNCNLFYLKAILQQTLSKQGHKL